MQLLGGGVPERPKGTGCKPVGSAFGGSNPPAPIPPDGTMLEPAFFHRQACHGRRKSANGPYPGPYLGFRRRRGMNDGSDYSGWEPDAEQIEAMIEAEAEFREAHGLQNDRDWDEYVDEVGQEWLASLPPEEPDWLYDETPTPAPTPRVRPSPGAPSPLPSSVPRELRGPHELTPIEAPFFDALAETGLTFSVQPFIQHADRRYRLDFLIHYDGRAVAVELDGHEYHKTKEQRTKDAARDRWLMARGIRVVRFTGSEVFADPQKCVRELLDVVRQSQARP
jgi:very-short-patch-repair endonuclease